MFNRDYSILLPIDHTLNSNWPTYDRNTKQDCQDRLADIISGFNSGETVKGVLNLPFIAQGSDPSTVTDQIQLYAKAVSTKTELFTKNEDGTVTQITSGGALNVTAAAMLAAVGPLIYPVGSYYSNDSVSTNPATLFGFGTWVAVAGRCIVGFDSGQTEFDSAGEEGGEKTHLLTGAESGLKDHTHNIATNKFTDQGTVVANTNNGDAFSRNIATAGSGSSDASSAHNNLQPFRVAYIWRRTA